MATWETTAVAELAEELRRTTSPARVATEGADYDAARALWNGAVDRRPGVVLRCRDAAGVQAGVRAAGRLGVPVSVRGGGHDWAGRAVRDGGLCLDLRGLRQVTVDADAQLADAGGGATATDLVAAAGAAGFVAVTGTVGSVGMAGLSLGGGYGPLSGRFGLAVDNLVSADVVLADGSMVRADADHEPDLWWALRGGGGNLGVVTSLRIRLHRVPGILAGMVVFPFEQVGSVLSALDGPLRHGPDEFTVQGGVFSVPGGPPAVFVLPTWCGQVDDGERAVASVTSLGTPLMAQVGPVTQVEMLAQTDGMFPFGRHVELRPRILPSLSAGAVSAIAAAGSALTSPLSSVSVHGLHGAAARPASDAVAFAHRTPHLMVETIAIWPADDPDGDRHAAWARNVSASLAPYALPGGYANLLAPDEHDQIAGAYGGNAERLLAVKRRYDPEGVFRAIPLPE